MLIVLGLVLFAADRTSKRDRTIEQIADARRVPDGARAGARADPGRVALGLDDHGRAVPRLRPHGRGPLLVPAVDPRRRAERACSSSARSSAGRRASTPARPSSSVATLLAFVTGYASIAFLLRWLTSHSMDIFVVYRVALGVIVLVLVGTGTIS